MNELMKDTYREVQNVCNEYDIFNNQARNSILALVEPLVDRITALEAELAALKDPWIRIDPEDEETLPREHNWYTVSIVYEGKEGVKIKQSSPAWYNTDKGDWFENDYSEELLLPNSGRVYAYQPLPAPAPLPDEAN